MKKISFIVLLSALLFNSCVEKIPVGFLSDTGIMMREDTMSVVKGVYTISSIPMIDGSTKPLSFEVVRVKNLETGQIAPEFSQQYNVKLWTSPYNPDTDVTMELVNQKLRNEMVYPLLINPVSGQLAFNTASLQLPGELYGVDVKVSNSAGSRIIENFGIVKLTNRPWQVASDFALYFHGTAGTTINHAVSVENPVRDMNAVRNNTHPSFRIDKVAESDIVEVKLSFYDTNGAAFHGEAITFWPDANVGYLNNWFDNSVETTVEADGVTFRFPTVPFPAFGRLYNDNQDRVALSYYTLHPDHYDLTPAAINIRNAWAAENPNTILTATNQRVRFTWIINEPGIWHVKVHFVNAIKK